MLPTLRLRPVVAAVGAEGGDDADLGPVGYANDLSARQGDGIGGLASVTGGGRLGVDGGGSRNP
jgi:hypothetical protein